MLLSENFSLLCNLNHSLRQASFRYARSYLRNGELTAHLQNQLWFVSMCVRRNVFPPTVSGLHLPSCIRESDLRSIQLHVLKKMKRGIRVNLETVKKRLRRLNEDMSNLPISDREGLRQARAQAFSNTYERESSHYRNRLRWLCGRQWRTNTATPANAVPTPTPTPTPTRRNRVTDKTGELTDVEKRVLNKGPKFALARAVNEKTKEDCQTAFARFAYQFRWQVDREGRGDLAAGEGDAVLPAFPRSANVHVPPTTMDTEAKLRRLYHTVMTIVESQPTREEWTNLPREEAKALRALRRKPVALMPSDKGGEFCAVDMDTYRDLGRSHLADNTTYQAIPRMSAKTIEGKINRTWRSICRERGVTTRLERSFISNNTRMATFRHVIKTHKPGPQLKIRPVIAGRGCPTEKIAWLLKVILSPLLSTVPAHASDSGSLMAAVLSTTPEVRTQYQHQCSLDVEALYTSVPVHEALEAVRRKLLLQGAIPQPLLIEDIIRLLDEVFSLTFFHYEGQVYRQIEGLPMGCAVSGIVAIIFMETVETRALALFGRCPLYRRYVDDCYALVSNEEEARHLQACFNEQHPRIRFQLENCNTEGDTTSLSLLDFTVSIGASGEVDFDFYTKEAKTSVFLHKESALPWAQKVATIRNEQRRIAARGGDSVPNREAFRNKLRENGYTAGDLARINASSRRRPNAHPEGTVHYIDLPFLGESAERKIRRAFTREGIRIRIYRRSASMLQWVRPKQAEIRRCAWTACPTREAGRCFVSNCVYLITCSPCGRRYVGSTTRPLHERIREHTVTGRGSNIHDHLTTCGEGAARVQIRVLATEKDPVNTRLREALLIKKMQPELNTRNDSDLVDLVF